MVEAMGADDRTRLAALGRRKVLARDMVLCHEGAPAGEVYLIESGSVRVVRTSSAGRELILATRTAGELVGEISAFDGRPRSAAMVANETTSVVGIPADRFRDAVEHHPRLAGWLLRQLAEKIRDADDRTAGRDNDDVRTRVVDCVVNLAMDRAGGTNRAKIPVRQADLASWVGASRETVARVLGELRSERLVHTGRGQIVVDDVAGLRQSVVAIE